MLDNKNAKSYYFQKLEAYKRRHTMMPVILWDNMETTLIKLLVKMLYRQEGPWRLASTNFPPELLLPIFSTYVCICILKYTFLSVVK